MQSRPFAHPSQNECMRTLLFLLILIFPHLAKPQMGMPPLGLTSSIAHLHVTQEEQLVLTSRVGEVRIAPSINGEWLHRDPLKIGACTADHGNFFNRDTGIVSGFISGKNSKYDIAYKTTDGGLTWKPIKFGQEGWVDDAINLDDGRAWFSVAGSGIAYTEDYGNTWTKIPIPRTEQRYDHIFFNAAKEGLIASLWNSLAYTSSNGAQWNQLPTPLDQRRYQKTNPGARPEFGKAAIFGNYLLVIQEDLVFVSRKDSIQWKWLDKYEDFFTDPQNSALFFKTNDGDFERADQSLNSIATIRCSAPYYPAQCRNGKLFLTTTEGVTVINTDNTVLNTQYPKNDAVVIPSTIGYCKRGEIGWQDSRLFLRKPIDGDWEPLAELPFSTEDGQVSMVTENEVLWQKDDSLAYFNFDTKETIYTNLNEMVHSFCQSRIEKIIFSQTSSGCFHSYRDEIAYTRNQESFENEGPVSKGSDHKASLAEYREDIEARLVDDFISKVPQLFDKKRLLTVSELQFTQDELEQCRKDIVDFRAAVQSGKKDKRTAFTLARNNINFERLIELVDSVQHISPQQLDYSLRNLSEMYSTTSYSSGFKLVNVAGATLYIYHRYCEPNAFNFPWTIDLNGYRFQVNQLTINHFLEKVYPGFLNEQNRIAVLHTLVRHLYENRYRKIP